MVGRWGPVGVSALVPAPGVLLECRPRWLPRPLRSPLRVWRCRLVPRACAALKCGCGRPCCGAGGRGAGVLVGVLPRLLASGVRACNNLENVRCVQCARHRIAHDIPGKIVLMSYWLVLMLVHVLRTIPDGLVQMHCTPTLVLRLDHKFARTKKLKAMAPPRIASTVKASNSSFGML